MKKSNGNIVGIFLISQFISFTFGTFFGANPGTGTMLLFTLFVMSITAYISSKTD